MSDRRAGRRTYREGDHLMVSDRSGQWMWASESRREWNGLIVHKDEWERRQPQDLVRGLIDHQVAEPSRPRPADTYIGPLTTTIASKDHGFSSGFSAGFKRPGMLAGDQLIVVAATAGMTAGDSLSIMLDNDETFRTTIDTMVNGTELTIADPLPDSVSVDNAVVDNSAVTEANIG